MVDRQPEQDPEVVEHYRYWYLAIQAHSGTDDYDWWRESNIERLGQGSSRIAYRLPDGKVMKISKSRVDPYQMRCEIHNWINAPEKIKQFLCPIVAYDPDCFWEVQEMATDVGDETAYIDSQLLRKIREMKLRDVPGYSDLCAYNVGTYQSRPVFVDYGLDEVFE